MALDPNREDFVIGVIGTGAMGRGIMQVAAQGGMRVVAYDEKAGAAESAVQEIRRALNGLVEKGRLEKNEADAAVARITIAEGIPQVAAAADVIIEAIIERLDVKQNLFETLDDLTKEDCILASNTSSLPITAIAARCKAPRARGRDAFLQSRATDEAGGSRPGTEDIAVGHGGFDGHRATDDPRSGGLQR